MTPEEIEKLTDRKLDALVAERVMDAPQEYQGIYANYYSTDWNAMRQVMEKMSLNKNACWYIETNLYTDGKLMYWVQYKLYEKSEFEHVYEGESFPRAVCIAALMAMGAVT